MATTNYLSTDPQAGIAYQPTGGTLLSGGGMSAAGAPQLDPNIIATTPFSGDTVYADKATGQRIDPNDPRIVAYTQQLQQWSHSHPWQDVPTLLKQQQASIDAQAAANGDTRPHIQYTDAQGLHNADGSLAGGIMLPGQQTGPASGGGWGSNPDIGLNGGLPGLGGTPGGGTAPQITNPTDPNQVRAFFQWRASQQGADPYLSQPGGVDYYTQKALENGGLTDQNYWTNKSTLAQFGGAVGAGGGQGGSGGGFGDTWNKLPSLQDAQNMPGLQFALDRGANAIQHSAFARGTGLSGGMLKDLADYTTGAALQGYGNLANLNLNYNQANAGNLLNLGQLGLSGSSIGATGRPA